VSKIHYHNVLLVRASNKLGALKIVKMFLEPHNEQIEVEPWKDYLTESDIKNMCKHYSIDSSDRMAILDVMPKWDGDNGGYDAEGNLFYWRTYNPIGEWDWYQFGGRWMWSELRKKYRDNIVKPNTDHYWNRYHDKEVVGKKWLCTFPDGTTQYLDYGSDFEIKGWVSAHPEHSEVIDATDPTFFDKIEYMKKYMRRHEAGGLGKRKHGKKMRIILWLIFTKIN